MPIGTGYENKNTACIYSGVQFLGYTSTTSGAPGINIYSETWLTPHGVKTRQGTFSSYGS
jgi:hypothetical protein